MNLKSKLQKKWLGVSNKVRKGFLRRGASKIAIVSSDKWLGKVLDDFLIQRELIRGGMNASIVSWQDKSVQYEDYDVILIGSMWGYQRELDDFWKFLSRLENSGATIINPVNVIGENCDKVKQFKLLNKMGLPVVGTKIIRTGELGDFTMPKDDIVIKPAISGGGDNTFLVHDEEDLARVRNKLARLNEKVELLVQPFLPEIAEGEIGVVMVGGKVVNVVRRFPGVIEGNFHVELVNRIEDELKELAEKAWKVYRGISYLRVDVVKIRDEYVIMEVEAFEPQLYYYLLDDERREKMLEEMRKEVQQVISERKSETVTNVNHGRS